MNAFTKYWKENHLFALFSCLFSWKSWMSHQRKRNSAKVGVWGRALKLCSILIAVSHHFICSFLSGGVSVLFLLRFVCLCIQSLKSSYQLLQNMRGVYLYLCYYTVAAEYTTLQPGNFNFLGSFLVFLLIWLMLKQGDFQLGKHEIGLIQPRWCCCRSIPKQ